MGNSSLSACPSYIAEQVEWKSGSIFDGLRPGYFNTYQDLQGDKSFREFLLRHMDSDYALLFVQSAVEDVDSLLKGLPKLQADDPELLEQVRASVTRIEKCVSAGVNVCM